MAAREGESELNVQMSVRLPKEHADALARIARENDRTISGELRRLIRIHCMPAPALSDTPERGTDGRS